MKKDLYDLFNDAEAEELQPLLENTPSETVSPATKNRIYHKVMGNVGVADSDEQELQPIFDEPHGKKRRKLQWLPFVAVAACVCLVFGWVFSIPRNGPGSPTGPMLTPPLPGENGIHAPEDLVNDFAYDQILWNPGTAEEDVPIQPEPGDPMDPSAPTDSDNKTDIEIQVPVEDEWVMWKGLKVTPTLLQYLESQPSAHLAVKAHSLKKPEVPLSDFEMDGVSYAAVEEKRMDFWNQYECVATLHKYVSFILEAGEMETWMEDQLASLDPNYIDLDNYRTEDGKWNLDQIVAEETGLWDAISQLDQQRESLFDAWSAQYGNYTDLSGLAEFGFYMVSTGSETTVAIVTAADMADFAKILTEHFPEGTVDSILFDMAYSSDVGVDTDDWVEPTYPGVDFPTYDETTPIGTMGPPITDDVVLPDTDLNYTVIGSAKVPDSMSVHLPDTKIMRSDMYGKQDCLYYTYEVPALTPIIEALPENWFDAYQIVFVRTASVSGSVNHTVTGVRLTEYGELIVDIETDVPPVSTMDICCEYFVIAIDAGADVWNVWVEETYPGYEGGLGPALPSQPGLPNS